LFHEAYVDDAKFGAMESRQQFKNELAADIAEARQSGITVRGAYDIETATQECFSVEVTKVEA
jgi:hypothetical protein